MCYILTKKAPFLKEINLIFAHKMPSFKEVIVRKQVNMRKKVLGYNSSVTSNLCGYCRGWAAPAVASPCFSWMREGKGSKQSGLTSLL